MQWKEVKVIVMWKPGKSSYTKARMYRPVSLLNHLAKLLETIVNNRLKKWIKRHKWSPLFNGDSVQGSMCRGPASV